jgi:hypothetical protein
MWSAKRYSAYFANAIRECVGEKNRFAAQSPPKNAHNETAINANECEVRQASRIDLRRVNLMPHPAAYELNRFVEPCCERISLHSEGASFASACEWRRMGFAQLE